MGAMFFMGFMLILLCFGGFFLLVGLIFLFLRHRSKKKGTSKKWHTVLAGASLALGAAICALPVGYWLFLRTANSSMFEDYVNTGKMVEGGFQDGTFTVDGVTYERLDVDLSGLCPEGTAVFSWENSSAWDRFFGYYNRGNYFAIENAPGLDLIRGGGFNNRLWCRSDQLAQAQEWYRDDVNYQWYLYDYNDGDRIYTLLSPQPDEEHMAALLDQEMAEMEFAVSNDAEIQEYILESISTDKIARRDSLCLAVYDGQLGLTGTRTYTEGTRTDTVYLLPADLADYFSDLLNIQKYASN